MVPQYSNSMLVNTMQDRYLQYIMTADMKLKEKKKNPIISIFIRCIIFVVQVIY